MIDLYIYFKFRNNNLKSSMILSQYLRLLIIMLLHTKILSFFSKIAELKVPNKIIGAGFDEDIIVITSADQKIYIYQNLTLLTTVQSLCYNPSDIGLITVRKNVSKIEIVLNNNLEASSISFQYMVFNISQKSIVNNYCSTKLNFKPLIFQIGKEQVLIVTEKWQVYTVNTTNGLISSNRRSLKAISSAKFHKSRNLYYLASEQGFITSYSPRQSYYQSLVQYWNFESYPLFQTIGASKQVYDSISTATLKFDQAGYGFGQYILVNSSEKIAFQSLKKINGSHTFSCWINFKFNNSITNQIFSAQNSHGIDYFNKKLIWKAKYQSQNGAIGWFNIMSPYYFQNTSAWYFISYTVDIENRLFKLYIDGELKFAIFLGIKTIISNNDLFYLGVKKTYGYAKSNVIMDEVKFFNRVLSQSEITQQYSNRPFQTNIHQMQIGEISQIVFSKYEQFMFCLDVDGNIGRIEIDQQGKLSLFKLFPIGNNHISLTLLRDFNQDTLITIDNIGNIKQHKFPNQTQVHKQSLSISSQKNFVLSPVYYTGKFVSVELGSHAIQIWNLQFRQNCHNSCLTCFHPDNKYMCNSCQQIYAQFDESEETIGFECRYQCGEAFNKIKGKCVPRSQQVLIASKSVSAFLSIPNLKILFKFAYSIFTFLEDLWFYKYHNKQYSTFIQEILQEAEKINQSKIFPQQLKFQALQQKIRQNKEFFQSNYKNFTKTSVVKNGVISTSFLANTTQIIVYGLINIACLTGLLLILSIFFNCIGRKSQTIANIQHKIKENVGLIFFIGGFCQTNLLGLVFFAFQQLTTPFAFNFLEKMNMLSAIGFLFLFLIYSLCFFLLTYKFVLKQRSQKVLKYTTRKFDSFMQATYILSSKQFFRGFIHGYLIGNNILQIVLLIVTSLIEIFFVINFRNSFECYPYLIFYMAYCISFLSLNLNFLLLQTADPSQVSMIISSTQFIEMIIIGVMFSGTVILVLYSLILPAYNFLKNKGLICNNKVQIYEQKNPKQNIQAADQTQSKETSTKQAKQIYTQGQRHLNEILDPKIYKFPFKDKNRQIQVILDQKDKQLFEAINQSKQLKLETIIQNSNKRKNLALVPRQDKQKRNKRALKKSPSKRLAQLKVFKQKTVNQNDLIIKRLE